MIHRADTAPRALRVMSRDATTTMSGGVLECSVGGRSVDPVDTALPEWSPAIRKSWMGPPTFVSTCNLVVALGAWNVGTSSFQSSGPVGTAISTYSGRSAAEGHTPMAQTELGRRLWEIRRKIIESGQVLLDWDGVNREVQSRRGDPQSRDSS